MLDIEEEWFFRDESPTNPKDVLFFKSVCFFSSVY